LAPILNISCLDPNFDALWYGDGNINILKNRNDGFRVEILNPMSSPANYYVKSVKDCMDELKDIDIITASAGFDQGIEDWGNLLSPKDYTTLGSMMKEYSEKLCDGRRFAILEGGYNHDVLGKNVNAFCQGFKYLRIPNNGISETGNRRTQSCYGHRDNGTG